MLEKGGLLLWPVCCCCCCSAITPHTHQTPKLSQSFNRVPISSVFLHTASLVTLTRLRTAEHPPTAGLSIASHMRRAGGRDPGCDWPASPASRPGIGQLTLASQRCRPPFNVTKPAAHSTVP
ncbi:hypothetical protein GWK47_050807 [Chionoecetes opilio]|uniref:Secreted protein n=1 Tax=Chionoecetes opilio TaxID=41210 RepID=A0A8J4Y1B6_CHIOP|nr:hypothetical protein GWK47_050807 [Chionoecetes opilio]